ncbi:hypothetical protein B0H13DRAFT_2569429 [Mycena leptocephala]|nr:hypothetical protein B0H13DRAFT_2569429 [Mycena leptocephala]
MSDESGRKGTGRMKPGNLTHSRSKNELDELPERDSKRQCGTKHHSFLRAFLWCVLNWSRWWHDLRGAIKCDARAYRSRICGTREVKWRRRRAEWMERLRGDRVRTLQRRSSGARWMLGGCVRVELRLSGDADLGDTMRLLVFVLFHGWG